MMLFIRYFFPPLSLIKAQACIFMHIPLNRGIISFVKQHPKKERVLIKDMHQLSAKIKHLR